MIQTKPRYTLTFSNAEGVKIESIKTSNLREAKRVCRTGVTKYAYVQGVVRCNIRNEDVYCINSKKS